MGMSAVHHLIDGRCCRSAAQRVARRLWYAAGVSAWSRVAIALGLAPLAFAVSIRVVAMPSTRALEVNTSGTHRGVRVFRDLGRGAWPPDSVVVEGSGRLHHALTFEAKALQLELLDAAPDARVDSVTLEGVPLQWPGPVHPIPPPRPWQLALAALFALALSLAGARWGPRWAAHHWSSPSALFRPSGAASAVAMFAGVIGALAVSADLVEAWLVRFDNPPFWPISIVDPATPSWAAIAAAGAMWLGLVVLTRVLDGRHLALAMVLGAATFATNSFHGWERGFVTPVSGPYSYWEDVKPDEPAVDFVRHFNERQRSLHTHSRTHPPLAVLVYAPFVAASSPGVAAIGLGLLALILSLLSLRSLLGAAGAPMLPVFAALPAVQVYFVSSLDALICAVFLSTLALALHERRPLRWLAVLPLVVAALLTFASVFLAAVLGWLAVSDRSRRRELAGVLLLTVLVLASLSPALGFDWWLAFRTATALENPNGFRLLAEPVTFLFTRLEGVAEVALFAGPLLCVLTVMALRQRPITFAWSWSGLLVWAAMLAAGAFKTGETARACLFVMPCVLALVASRNLERRHVTLLTLSLFAQTLIMQLWGDFFW